MTENDAWFAPKRYGYGAGLPIAWQGWALVASVMALALVTGWLLLPRHATLAAAILVPIIGAVVPVAARHTRGGWRWRWGDAD